MNAVRSPAPVFSDMMNKANSAITNTVAGVANQLNSTPVAVKRSFAWVPVLLIGIVLTTIITLIYYYKDTIYNYFYPPESPQPVPEPQPAPTPPPPPPPPPSPLVASVIENTLPERRQVFNISDNRYTYYDAEPLCKALGAELATYDQVKKAYEDGGDWCNYGWSAGQMALYPTQGDTWQKLQAGTEDQRTSCGKVGLNGGYFDNPELRFGVNCYGAKPPKKSHDASIVSNNDNYPATPETIEFDKKVAKYRSIANTVGILPFKNNKWSA